MVIHFPADFSEKLSAQGEQIQLNFYIDQSVPQLTSGAMQSVASQIAGQIEQSLSAEMAGGILKGMNVPEERAAQLADQIVNKLNTNVVNTNSPLTGLHNMMAPMFLTMSLYIGAMTFSMVGMQSLTGLRREFGLWKAFGAMLGGNLLIAVFTPLVGLAIYFGIFQSYSFGTMAVVWLSHALFMFAAICFTSVISLLAGQASTFVQTPLLMLQIIACGAMMTQDMMPGLFEFVSHISVMYYSVQSDYAMLFAGQASAADIGMMAVIAVVSAVLGLIVFSRKKAAAEDAASFPLNRQPDLYTLEWSEAIGTIVSLQI